MLKINYEGRYISEKCIVVCYTVIYDLVLNYTLCNLLNLLENKFEVNLNKFIKAFKTF